MTLPELLRRSEGLIRLRPNFVKRSYANLNRLHQNDPRTPERWIGSTTRATTGGGLSMLHDADISLADFLREIDQSFDVLVKILDPGEPIPLHLHATDAQVRKHPRQFPGERFGKDEAYYFLDAPKGPVPYTHAGLNAGVTERELIDAIRRSHDHALELSPAFYQTIGEGFFVPAGVPHRPGTALTLEIQQPSDVATMLNSSRDLDQIDFPLSHRVGSLLSHQIRPKTRRVKGGTIAEIFPRRLCRKFGGDRIDAVASMKYRKKSALALLVWRGRGKIDGQRVRAGEEFFITRIAATRGIAIEPDAPMQLFTFLPES